MSDLEFNKKNIIIIGIILVFIILLFGSVKIVKSGQAGIKVRFGKVTDSQLSEGINLKVPFIEKIVKMNVKVQKAEIETESSSKDLQTIKMKVAVNYKVNRKEAMNLYKNVGEKYEEIVLQPAIQESIKASTSKYTAEELITNRSEVSKTCMLELENKIKKYGLNVDNFDIIDFDFSNEFNKAIEEKQVAEQKVLTAKQELEKEKIKSEEKIVKAEAEKRANEMKQQSLTDNIIKEKFIEKWNGEMPKVSGNGSIIDINSILG